MARKKADETYLSDLSPHDKPWDTHRSQSEAVERLYSVGGFDRYSERVQECSKRLQFALSADEQGDVVFKLYAARFCRVRFCPVCQWRRSLMWRARFYQALPRFLEDYPTLIAVFLTLTVKNCPVGELRSQIQVMNKSFVRLTQRNTWPGVGWVKSVEVTRNAQTGDAHPHFHVLLFVRPSYFSHGYINQAKWRELWRDCLRVDYLPVVNVKRVKSSSKKTDSEALRIAILETLKYGVKPDDLVSDSEWLYGVTHQLHKMRAVSVGGILRDYLREDEPEDLIHEEEMPSEELEGVTYLCFDWMALVKRYAQAVTPD